MRHLILDKDEQPSPKGRALMCIGLAVTFCLLMVIDVFEQWWIEAIWGAVVLLILAFAMMALVKRLGWTQPFDETELR